MKENLSPESIDALVNYRLSRALETLDEVPFLQSKGFYNTALNRLYYACYYVTSALLLKNGYSPSTHSGVKQLLGMYFVSTVLVSKNAGRYFSILFDRRHSSDYDDFTFVSAEEIDELYSRALKYVEELKSAIMQ